MAEDHVLDVPNLSEHLLSAPWADVVGLRGVSLLRMLIGEYPFEDEWTEGWKQKVWYVLCPGCGSPPSAMPRLTEVYLPALPGLAEHPAGHHRGELLASEAGDR